jgi:hypothetical protein
MNSWLMTAAGLTVLIGVAHSWLGERYLIGRLLERRDLPRLLGDDRFTKGVLRFAWHLTSVAWTGLAGVMAVLAAARPDATARALGQVLAATFLVHAVVALVGSRGRHLSWVVFLAITIAIWLGS